MNVTEFANVKHVKLFKPGIHKGQHFTPERVRRMATSTMECLDYFLESLEKGIYEYNGHINLGGKPIPALINLNHQEDLAETIKNAAKQIGVKLYTEVEKGTEWLIGDFTNVPNDLAKFLKKKYPFRSIELMPPVYHPKKKKIFFDAVRSFSFLDFLTPPAVKGQVNDFVVTYADACLPIGMENQYNIIQTFVLDMETEENKEEHLMAEQQTVTEAPEEEKKTPVRGKGSKKSDKSGSDIQEFQTQITELQKEITEYKEKFEASEKDKEKLVSVLNKVAEDQQEQEKQRAQKEITNFCATLVKYHHIKPALLDDAFQEQLRLIDNHEILEFGEVKQTKRDYWLNWVTTVLTEDTKVPVEEYAASEGKSPAQTVDDIVQTYMQKAEEIEDEDEQRKAMVQAFFKEE